MNQHRFGVNAAYLGAKAARTPDERPGPAGWSGALLLDEFYRANGNPGLVTPTKAQAAWDDTFLYVLFLNWESAENADQVRRDIDELVVSSGTLGHRDFAVFSVGRNGEAHGVLESGMTYIGGDEAFGGSQPNLPFRHVGNQADIQTIDPQSYTVVVDHQAGFWSAAYKIPWTLVGGFPKGDCFAFQVYRKKQATGEILCPTPLDLYINLPYWFEYDPSTFMEAYLGGDAGPVYGTELYYYNNKPAANDSAIAAAWQQAYDSASDSDTPTRCSVTGRLAPAARLHGNIQGVRGAQSSGASLVSFNAEAFCSYGHEQGENAPVSTYAMTAYTQALNYLLRSDNVRRIGDVTVVYWVENADPAIAAFAGAMLFGPQEQSDWSENDILGAIQKLVSGRTADLQDMHLSPDTHFYILGLAPNAARLSVRFFWQDTFTKLAKNVNAHYERLEITRPAYEKFDTLWPYTLARSAVRFSKDWKKADEELQKSFPRLSGDLLTSILNDTRYPATLLNGTVQRIRAEHDVTRARASVIKAYYSKNEDPLCPKEVLTVSVNKESTNIPYNLGRLFAVLERTQEAANPNINTTIKDRFFNSASSTPSLVFPTLINLAQKHLAKLNEGQRITLDKSIGELSDKLGETFPKQLMLAEQGAFQLGYYQQRQEFFKKKTDTTEQKEEA